MMKRTHGGVQVAPKRSRLDDRAQYHQIGGESALKLAGGGKLYGGHRTTLAGHVFPAL